MQFMVHDKRMAILKRNTPDDLVNSSVVVVSLGISPAKHGDRLSKALEELRNGRPVIIEAPISEADLSHNHAPLYQALVSYENLRWACGSNRSFADLWRAAREITALG